MDSARIKDFIERIPFPLLAFLFIGYMGFDYYSFENSPDSPLLVKQGELAKQKIETTKLQEKLKKAEEFLRSLEAKKVELGVLGHQLLDMKGTLSESLDIPEFMKMTVTEAKKVNLNVLAIKPTKRVESEYYAEQPFEFKFRGVFVQLVVFFERMSNVQKIVRIENFDMKPVGSPSARYVELEGTIEIKTYQYLGSKADEVLRKKVSMQTTEAVASPPAASAPAGAAPTPDGKPAAGGGK